MFGWVLNKRLNMIKKICKVFGILFQYSCKYIILLKHLFNLIPEFLSDFLQIKLLLVLSFLRLDHLCTLWYLNLLIILHQYILVSQISNGGTVKLTGNLLKVRGILKSSNIATSVLIVASLFADISFFLFFNRRHFWISLFCLIFRIFIARNYFFNCLIKQPHNLICLLYTFLFQF